MRTVIGTGASPSSTTSQAARDAVGEALQTLGTRGTSHGFVFAGPGHDLPLALRTVSDITKCPNLIGCSTAGEFTEKGLLHGGIVVMLVSAPSTESVVRYGGNLAAAPEQVATAIAEGHAESKRRAFAHDCPHPVSIVLTDGLVGTGETLIDTLVDRLAGAPPIVGGAAGDEGQFKGTQVATLDRSSGDAAVALHVFGARPWGIGVNHGLRATTEPMTVTRAEGNIVYELAGRPAFDVYKEHAASRGVTLTRENAGPYLIGNELGIHVFSRIARARAPLFVGDDGALTCAAGIREGSMVSILDGDPTAMLEAARRAAQEAKGHTANGEVAGVLVFDCVCRGMILGDRFGEEIAAIRESFGDVPVAGFLTYGEIARYPGRLSGWHNTTAVVAAIPA